MEFRDGYIQGFEPDYRGVRGDCDRYLDQLYDLDSAGMIPETGKPLLHYLLAGYDRIYEAYFDGRHYDHLEQYFMPDGVSLTENKAGDVVFGGLHQKAAEVIARFVQLGQGRRAVRMWRSHITALLTAFWNEIDYRNRGFKFVGRIGMGREEQLARFETEIAGIPAKKASILEDLARFHTLCSELDFAKAELPRVDADIAAVMAEQRPAPVGVPDKRAMTEDVFWELIEHGRNGMPRNEALAMLPDRLALFGPTAIREFDRIIRAKDATAYRSDIWALAYLLMGGCSDDSFDEFRGWLILQGRAVFEGVMTNPDDFDVRLFPGRCILPRPIWDIAPMAYGMRQGKAMPPTRAILPNLTGPDWDEGQLPQMFPKVARALSG